MLSRYLLATADREREGGAEGEGGEAFLYPLEGVNNNNNNRKSK